MNATRARAVLHVAWGLCALLLPGHAISQVPSELPLPEVGYPLLALLASGVALGLAGLACLRGRRATAMPDAEIAEMRHSVTAFAALLRDGSEILMKTNAETLEAAHHLATRSDQLIALLAGAEARMLGATERSEILATRVAKSAAAEIKDAVKNLAEISARIEEASLSRPADVPGA